MNPKVVENLFKLVEVFLVEARIAPENIYGMDESGFVLSDQGTTRVVRGCGKKVQHEQTSGDQENVTVLATICADGTALKSTIVFKGQNS